MAVMKKLTIGGVTYDTVGEASVSQVVSTGTKIATVTIDGTATDLYAPSGGSSVDPATATPIMDGTAAVGSSAKYAREDHVHPTDTSRQATLVSGTNIKTINNESILGSGNISISGGSGSGSGATILQGQLFIRDANVSSVWELLGLSASLQNGDFVYAEVNTSHTEYENTYIYYDGANYPIIDCINRQYSPYWDVNDIIFMKFTEDGFILLASNTTTLFHTPGVKTIQYASLSRYSGDDIYLTMAETNIIKTSFIGFFTSTAYTPTTTATTNVYINNVARGTLHVANLVGTTVYKFKFPANSFIILHYSRWEVFSVVSINTNIVAIADSGGGGSND